MVLEELRYAARSLRAAPEFTVAALATLALAIGANSAIFSVVNGLLLRPLPFPAPDRLAQVSYYVAGMPDNPPIVDVQLFEVWRRGTGEAFSGLAAHTSRELNLTGAGLPDRVRGAVVSAGLFGVLGVEPALGRGFGTADGRPGGPRVAVLSHALWYQRFGADPAILGREVLLDGEATTIVGVMPERFAFPPEADLWLPLSDEPKRVAYFEVVGRLRPGRDTSEAVAAVVAATRRGHAAGELERIAGRYEVVPLMEQLYGGQRPLLAALAGAVVSVLLIACVNLANLELARAAARQREMAIRSAMGAGPWRIARLVLVESVALAVAGGVAGLAVAYGSLPALAALLPEEVRALAVLRVDAAVLAFTLALSVATGVLFGLAPALLAARADLHQPLRVGATLPTARTAGPGAPGGRRLRWLLIVGEVALAQVLLTSALLLAKTFVGLLGTDPGFAVDSVLTLRLSPSEAEYGDAPALDRFTREVAARVEALPGVESAGIIAPIPMGIPGAAVAAELPFVVDGVWAGGLRYGDPGVGAAEYRPLTPGAFDALGLRLVRGRPLAPADSRAGAPLVALVNESGARMVASAAGRRDPLGQRITVGLPLAPELADPTPRRVVGVVENVKEWGLDEPEIATIYVPVAQVPQPIVRLVVRLVPIHLVVRASGHPETVGAAVRGAVWEVDSRQPVTDVRPMREVLSGSLEARRTQALLMGLLALVALVLAVVGISGVVAYLVGQRTREIGIRLAFGATGAGVLRLVVRQGTPSIVAGVLLGSAGSLVVVRALLAADLLHGVGPADPAGLLLAPALLAAVALLAIVLPAGRASRLEPMAALGRE